LRAHAEQAHRAARGAPAFASVMASYYLMIAKPLAVAG
jgi:uncharacterized membrane protein